MNPPTKKFLEVVQALNTLAREMDLSIHITVPSSEPAPIDVHTGEDRKQALLQQHRQDLAWLQSKLTQDENAFTQLKGNYLVVHNQQIISISEDELMACLGAAQTLDGIEESDLLVVPVCVSGDESEQAWLDIKERLGMK